MERAKPQMPRILGIDDLTRRSSGLTLSYQSVPFEQEKVKFDDSLAVNLASRDAEVRNRLRPFKSVRATVGLLALLVSLAVAVPGQAENQLAKLTDDHLSELTRKAYVYTLPSVIMYRTRWRRQQQFSGSLAIQGSNNFHHVRQRATPASRAVTAPNTDTLYSSAWLDLSAGPVELQVPATGDRYYSLQFIDFFTNSFAYIGRRTGVTEGGRFFITGPNWQGEVPAGARKISAPTNSVWLLNRILIDGADDLPNIHELQNNFILSSSHQPASRDSLPGMTDYIGGSGDPLYHFVVANAVLTENSPPANEAKLLDRLAAINVGPNLNFDLAKLNSDQRRVMEDAIATVRQRMRATARYARAGNSGWSQPRFDIGFYGKNYRLRAHVAISGLGANIPKEAMYFRLVTDSSGSPPNGKHRYVLHFDADNLPPVAAFWSLTAYLGEKDGRKFLAPNSIGRYALGSHSDGLTYNKDGSLTIYVQHEKPMKSEYSNWLPVPSGDFHLTMRAYQPDTALLDGTYLLPPLTSLPPR